MSDSFSIAIQATSPLEAKSSERRPGWAPRGFTLLEMLVVVAIFMVMLGILSGYIRTARAAALSANCQSNLRVLQTGWQMHVQSNQYKITYTFQNKHPNWADAMDAMFPRAPYLIQTNAVSFNACPWVQQNYKSTFYSYARWGYSINMCWTDSTIPYNDRQNWLAVRNPYRYPWFTDPQMFAASGGYMGPYRVPYPFLGAPYWGVGPNHDNAQRANVSFADCSVRSVPIREVTDNTVGSGSYAWFENR